MTDSWFAANKQLRILDNQLQQARRMVVCGLNTVMAVYLCACTPHNIERKLK